MISAFLDATDRARPLHDGTPPEAQESKLGPDPNNQLRPVSTDRVVPMDEGKRRQQKTSGVGERSYLLTPGLEACASAVDSTPGAAARRQTKIRPSIPPSLHYQLLY